MLTRRLLSLLGATPTHLQDTCPVPRARTPYPYTRGRGRGRAAVAAADVAVAAAVAADAAAWGADGGTLGFWASRIF